MDGRCVLCYICFVYIIWWVHVSVADKQIRGDNSRVKINTQKNKVSQQNAPQAYVRLWASPLLCHWPIHAHRSILVPVVNELQRQQNCAQNGGVSALCDAYSAIRKMSFDKPNDIDETRTEANTLGLTYECANTWDEDREAGDMLRKQIGSSFSSIAVGGGVAENCLLESFHNSIIVRIDARGHSFVFLNDENKYGRPHWLPIHERKMCVGRGVALFSFFPCAKESIRNRSILVIKSSILLEFQTDRMTCPRF